jgi:hypothetical protein
MVGTQESVFYRLSRLFLCMLRSEPHCLVICVCLGMLYAECEGYTQIVSQNEQRSKMRVLASKLFKPVAVGKEECSYFLWN